MFKRQAFSSPLTSDSSSEKLILMIVNIYVTSKVGIVTILTISGPFQCGVSQILIPNLLEIGRGAFFFLSLVQLHNVLRNNVSVIYQVWHVNCGWLWPR